MSLVKRILLGTGVMAFYILGAIIIWGVFALVSTIFISIGA
jgi:hypothetical protein